MMIEECASGGKRNDLEMMRRSVPLWRSDFPSGVVENQRMTYGISMWIPYHGTGVFVEIAISAENTPATRGPNRLDAESVPTAI